jgi:molecular chaperone DnaK (HSP70)
MVCHMQNSGKAAVAVVLLLATTTSGAVIGIDFGARFLKVGIIRPGTGIEMVLNEATQRKSSSSAGFTALEERVYGNEAQNMLGKVPERIFIMSKLLLGQTLDSEAITDFKR